MYRSINDYFCSPPVFYHVRAYIPRISRDWSHWPKVCPAHRSMRVGHRRVFGYYAFVPGHHTTIAPVCLTEHQLIAVHIDYQRTLLHRPMCLSIRSLRAIVVNAESR